MKIRWYGMKTACASRVFHFKVLNYKFWFLYSRFWTLDSGHQNFNTVDFETTRTSKKWRWNEHPTSQNNHNFFFFIPFSSFSLQRSTKSPSPLPFHHKQTTLQKFDRTYNVQWSCVQSTKCVPDNSIFLGECESRIQREEFNRCSF